LALLFSCLAAVFEGFGLGFLLAFLQGLTNPAEQPITTGIEWFDIWILGAQGSATSQLYRVSALILLSTWIRASFNYLSQVHTQWVGLHLINQLRQQFFEQLQAQSLSYFTNKRSGDLIDVFTTNTERIRQVFIGIAFLVTRGLTIVVYAITLFLLSWQLTLLAVLVFGTLTFGLSGLNRRIRERSFEITKTSARYTSNTLELISGIKTVHAFGTQEFERKKFYQTSFDLMQAWKRVIGLSAFVKPLAEIASITLLVSMIVLAITSGLMEVASLLTFFFVLFRLVPILQDMNGVIADLSTLGGTLDNINQLLKPDDKIYFQNGEAEFLGLKQAIDFEAVDFAYDGQNLVLHNVTFSIERDKMTALVGASGAGKTTIAELVTRFYDPSAGRVLINGVDLRTFDINSVRRRVAVVSQDTFIFNASVSENIAYGTPNATADQIEKAAQLAHALEFIWEMPEGFKTQLGDRGVRLSGGQRQRIAIARALLRNPEILILDEATSALDSISEKLIQEALEKLAIGRTVIVIAHRLSTIAKADKVVVLEQGRIVEQGTYSELIARRSRFWNYYQIQQSASPAESAVFTE
jgi:subfamily B ATP-binding cassette protein MsbA